MKVPAFLPETQAILEEVEAVTGKGFRFEERPGMAQLAGVKMARQGMVQHIVYYRSAATPVLDHLVAHECGHILRMGDVPVEDRKVPVTNRKTMTNALSPVLPELERIAAQLPGEAGPELLGFLYGGIVRQLTNYPSDLAIERWLHDNYKTLRSSQYESLRGQLRDAEKGLERRIRVMTPKVIYEAANVMNYAFFALLERELGEALLGLFAASEFKPRGQALAEQTGSFSQKSYLEDMAMVDRWASFLGLDGWYEWVPFDQVPEGYSES